MSSALVRARGLSKVYGARGVKYEALRGLDLDVERGEFVGVMGPSGAGKTTLLNIIATIDRPSAGEILVAGTDLFSCPERELARFRRERLGFVFQDFNLLDTLTAYENVALPLALAGLPGDELDAKARAAAARLSISEIADKFPWELSGGQRQRVSAARAIAPGPALLLADEPTGNLDSRAAAGLLSSFSSLNVDEGTTILMVTHDALAASYCTRVVFILDGSVYAEVRSGGDRRAFFDSLMEALKAMEGGVR
ncbi:MAG: ABC transporter ATP-binding protein [Spirochaetes bacterium]|nr:ABC transporter ATP-binding protein [Spirochaetota bacterium]MBU1081769.1 ABC transporter ATP-binding protein [Spirochaetota bacterium]